MKIEVELTRKEYKAPHAATLIGCELQDVYSINRVLGRNLKQPVPREDILTYKQIYETMLNYNLKPRIAAAAVLGPEAVVKDKRQSSAVSSLADGAAN